MEELDYYILFPNVSEGLHLEKKLKESSIPYTITPTPRELSTCCGICIKYGIDHEGAIKDIVEKNQINIMGFHSLKKKKYAVKFI